jgi:hypothetical protein
MTQLPPNGATLGFEETLPGRPSAFLTVCACYSMLYHNNIPVALPRDNKEGPPKTPWFPVRPAQKAN